MSFSWLSIPDISESRGDHKSLRYLPEHLERLPSPVLTIDDTHTPMETPSPRRRSPIVEMDSTATYLQEPPPNEASEHRPVDTGFQMKIEEPPTEAQMRNTSGSSGALFIPSNNGDDDDDADSESSDGLPVHNHHLLRVRARKHNDALHSTAHFPPKNNNTASTTHETTTRSFFAQKPKAPPIVVEKARKKPGPQPWAKKPISKNDMAAKIEVIHEIEKNWGKGFTKTFIPKCHRPLVKRDKGRKRTVFRQHETDPTQWLPSILKAILMISKLTQDKAWLKKAMDEVVRYRIRNTGNRKPQLVTTDMDVIEDMLVRNWAVDESFKVRYKHLLMNQKHRPQTEEDIDHILKAGCGSEDSSDSGDSEDGDQIKIHPRKKHKNTKGDAVYGQDLSNDYHQASGYTATSQSPQMAQERKPTNADGLAPHMHQPRMFGYDQRMQNYGGPSMGYGAPMPGYASSNAYGGYDGPRGYGGYNSYYPLNHPTQSPYQAYGQHMCYPPGSYPNTPSPSFTSAESRFGSSKPSPYTQMPPFGHSQNSGPRPSDTSSNPASRIGPGTPDFPSPYQSAYPRIKREPSPDDRLASLNEMRAPIHDQDMMEDDVDGSDGDAALLAQMKAAEAEMKYARLKAKYEESRKRKFGNRGSTAQDPVNLD